MSTNLWSRVRSFASSSGKLGSVVCGRKARLLQLAAVFGLCLAQSVSGFTGPDISKVEEDWVIEIGEPNADEVSPQIFVVSTPSGTLDGKHAVFEINNLVLPNFYGGGLQFQTWNGETNIGECHHSNFNALATQGEQITFTLKMRVTDGQVTFNVLNGHSTTWGDFGGDSLKLSHNSDVSDLTGYSPDKSVKFAKVGFGGNRVTKFVLKEVRYYYLGNLVTTDTTERDVLAANP